MNTPFFQRIRLYIKNHTARSIIIAIIAVLVIYFAVHAIIKKTAPTTYVLGSVQTGTIVSTITGTGQISTSNTVALKPQVSGQLLSARVKTGSTVSKGQVLYTIQATDAARAVQTAKGNLASAQLALRAAQTSDTNNSSDLAKAVTTAYNTLLSSNLQATPADTDTSSVQAPTISGNYTLGKEGTITVKTYSSFGGVSFQTSGLVATTGLTNSTNAQPIGTSGLYILFPNNVKGNLTWTISIPNTNSSSYVSNENAYETAKENEAEAADPNGSNAVDLQSKQLAVASAQNSLASAEETLAQYTITSPFDGVLASSTANVGDQVSSADTLGTVITNQEVATLSLNEVDVSKVHVGQKATLTFDAVDGLSLAGTVSTVDQVGTVSSGVVNYSVTISLDTQDPRVKSGMTVTAAIQAGIAQDVLTVPASAVHTSNGASYVLSVPDGDTSMPATSTGTTAAVGVTLATPPTQTAVEIGLTDGTNTEIASGLTEGQKIVTKTVAATTTKAAATTAPSLLGGGSNNRSFGGTTRSTTRIGG
ncbi:MAG TPA: efflux RND transporter periplasmic adaptor subunit [Candidatus Paceibacterota bacterium]|jgi:HlyD family secretion protein|nr:efflux RND transporter periplasmic adaptor subunit [Candidatus Paceibacterota bacterium]